MMNGGFESARRVLDQVQEHPQEYNRAAGDFRTHLFDHTDFIDLTELGNVDEIATPKAHLPGFFPRASPELLSQQQLNIYVRTLKRQRAGCLQNEVLSTCPRRPSSVSQYHSGPGYRSSIPGEAARATYPAIERGLLPSSYSLGGPHCASPKKENGSAIGLVSLRSRHMRPPKSGGRRVHPGLVAGDVASLTELNSHLNLESEVPDVNRVMTWRPQDMYATW